MIGLAADIGTYSGVGTTVGAPANFVAAVVKGLIKIPGVRPVLRAVVRIGGGGIAGLRLLARYILNFAHRFESVADYVSPAKLYEFLRDLIEQLFRMRGEKGTSLVLACRVAAR